METEIIIALIAFLSSAFGGLVVAVINHLFTRKKTEAETKKLEAEIDKLKAETQKTLAETKRISSDTKHALSEANYQDSAKINETVLYDGKQNFHGYDIQSDLFEYTIQQEVIVIHAEEAYLELRTYIYKGKESTFIPKDELISGYRKFHISCDAKVISASYEVNIFMMEEPDLEGHSVDDRRITVKDTEWSKIDFYLRAFPNKGYVVNIGVERISGNGSIQIKNLVVTEGGG
ncbi:MAG: hypothetical protein HYZ21_02315 [Chloroflexi bacterium]|nr:hypothetical protein [Chloroflexota bacterium]